MEQIPPQKLTFQNTHDFREQYANSINLRGTLWDFAFTFGLIEATAPDAVTVKAFQTIYVSPQQAKALHQVLGQNIENYEKSFGPIVIAPVNQMPMGTGKPQ